MVHKINVDAYVTVLSDDPMRGLLFVDGKYIAGGDKEMMRKILKNIKSGSSPKDALKMEGLV